MAAKTDLCPDLGELPKTFISEDLRARSALIGAISGSLCLDLVKSSSDSSTLNALMDSRCQILLPCYPELDSRLRKCTEEPPRLRLQLQSEGKTYCQGPD